MHTKISRSDGWLCILRSVWFVQRPHQQPRRRDKTMWILNKNRAVVCNAEQWTASHPKRLRSRLEPSHITKYCSSIANERYFGASRRVADHRPSIFLFFCLFFIIFCLRSKSKTKRPTKEWNFGQPRTNDMSGMRLLSSSSCSTSTILVTHLCWN